MPLPEYRGALEPQSTMDGDALGSIASRARPGLAHAWDAMDPSRKRTSFERFSRPTTNNGPTRILLPLAQIVAPLRAVTHT